MLKYARIRFLCRWASDRRIDSPLHWRDDLEQALRRVACILPRQKCQGCIVRERCTYTGLFHPQDFLLRAAKVRGGDFPLPFATMFPKDGGSDETFELEFSIVGLWVQRLPYWILGVERLGKNNKHPFSVQCGEVLTEEGWKPFWDGEKKALVHRVDARGPMIPELGEKATITWIRPVRALRTGKPLIKMDFEDLVVALARRVKALEAHYGEGQVSDFQHLLERAKKVECNSNGLRWVEEHRLSKRQGQSVSLSGLMGSMVVRGHLEPFGELLALGRDLGVGKGTALGLGRYEIVTQE